MADSSLWGQYALSSIKLAMVDTIEICMTVYAISLLDPFRRLSDPNKVLMAMALANMTGSQLAPGGSQSGIPGCMKSVTMALLGAVTRNASLICALLVLVTVSFATTRDVINHLTLVSLSAIIGYSGWRLCRPQVWIDNIASGRERDRDKHEQCAD